MTQLSGVSQRRHVTPGPPRLAVVRPSASTGPAPTAPSGWDRTSYLPGASELKPPADARARAKAIFAISEAKSKAEARQVGAFFERYPSRGADQVVFFHSYWAQHQTFQRVPLQAFLYSRTRPTDEAGAPKNALWRRYAELVETGASPKAIETAFFRAHIAEFKSAVKTPEFKQLYALSTPKYRRVVEAYLDTLAESERELNRGGDATQTGRWLFPRTVAWLTRKKVWDNGFMATLEGAKAMLSPSDPLNKQFWHAFKNIAASLALDTPPERKAPSAVVVSLSKAEAERLKAQTGIPFKAGRQELTEAMLEHASVAEPERRARPAGEPRRYPLRMSDFTAVDKGHPELFRAGADGVLNASEIDGVVRHVQGLVRSQLIEDFYRRYPVPHAGVHLYSANMLAMNGAYAASEMAHTLANAIMPVDNDGKPKNAMWQAYADACDRHQRTGAPSQQALESLWWQAHMEDFMIVDTPEFQRLLAEFWPQAEQDPALEPLATYARAMVWGRQNFERDRKTHSEDAAFATFIRHFSQTLIEAGSFPYWKQDLAEAKAWLKERPTEKLDDRGLPTDATLFERTVVGARDMVGLHGTVRRGVKQVLRGEGQRAPVSAMVDLAQVLTPAQLKQVDPRVVAFYKRPDRFDITAGIDVGDGLLSRLFLGRLAPALSGMSKLPDRAEGFEGFALESELYRDAKGQTRWDRYVVVDGQRQPLFLAGFETEGRQVKETFTVRGKTLTLYFDVAPYKGGVRLTVDREKSSKLAAESDIVFTVLPGPDGLVTTGRFQDPTGLTAQTFTMKMRPPAPAQGLKGRPLA